MFVVALWLGVTWLCGLLVQSRLVACVMGTLGGATILVVRNRDFGTDTSSYIVQYELWASLTWDELVFQLSYLEVKDPAFYVIGWAVAQVGLSADQWISLIAIAGMGFIGLGVWKLSLNPTLSFLLFVALGHFAFFTSGLRQSLAIGLGFVAVTFLLERNWTVWWVLLGFASAFHLSAVALSFLALALWVRQLTSFALLTVVFVGASWLWLLGAIDGFAPDRFEYVRSSEGLNAVGLVINACVSTFMSVAAMTEAGRRSSDLRVLTRAAWLGVAFFGLAMFAAEAFRIGLYFTILTIVGVPLAIACLTRESRLSTALHLAVTVLAVSYVVVGSSFSGLMG